MISDIYLSEKIKNDCCVPCLTFLILMYIKNDLTVVYLRID